jgi:hypothetical protein
MWQEFDFRDGGGRYLYFADGVLLGRQAEAEVSTLQKIPNRSFKASTLLYPPSVATGPCELTSHKSRNHGV